jgi:DNA-binding XRE family transcriptional regulator
MPRTRVVFYRESDGSVPLLDWFDEIPKKARVKCRLRVERLRELGYELRRPEADYLRDDIFELRVRLEGVNYRMLYFYFRDVAAVVSHGITKERIVPPKEIDRALARKTGVRIQPGSAFVSRRRNTMKHKRKPTSDAVEILHRRYFEGKPEMLAMLEEARAEDEIARKIYGLRTKAGLSQRQLAKLVGTTASVICRLEDADYDGHSLAMLRRIAAAVNKRVEIRFVRLKSKRLTA